MALSATNIAAAIETAFVAEWLSVKGENLAAYGQQERRILFVSIARGMLQYLEANQNEIVNSLTLELSPGLEQTYNVAALDLNA
jgi:hypothetical protein